MKPNKECKVIISEIIAEIDQNSVLFKDPSIENGKMGLAIFYFFCQKFFDDDKYQKKAEEMIEDSIGLLTEISLSEIFSPKYRGDSLSNIISSFGKGLMFVQYQLNKSYDFTEYYDIINNILCKLTKSSLKDQDFDFFSGALSSGHYFLNNFYHTKNEFSREMLLVIVKSLKKYAISHSDNQVYWKSPFYGHQIYLGISHGSAMIINFLCKLFKIGLLTKDSHAELVLLEKAVNFVLDQKRNLSTGFFPNLYGADGEISSTQFSLCYGDLGVIYALNNASKILKTGNLSDNINYLTYKCLQRKNDIKFTFDATIFYGAAGIYCVYKDMYLKSGDNIYKKAYQYWYDQITTYRDPDYQAMAGFAESSIYDEDKNNESVKWSYGWGISGIGICLMSGLMPELPSISETLLIGI